eukprot:2839632-Pyramimonas_sp.AAC.1
MKGSSVTTHAPPARKPHVRTDRSRVSEFGAYGFRPVQHPWKLLSAHEFLRQWRCEPLLVPTHYLNRNLAPRTARTKEDQQLIRSKQYKDGEVAAEPGEHYIAVTPEAD